MNDFLDILLTVSTVIGLPAIVTATINRYYNRRDYKSKEAKEMAKRVTELEEKSEKIEGLYTMLSKEKNEYIENANLVFEKVRDIAVWDGIKCHN